MQKRGRSPGTPSPLAAVPALLLALALLLLAVPAAPALASRAAGACSGSGTSDVTCPVQVGSAGTSEGGAELQLSLTPGAALYAVSMTAYPENPCLLVCFQPGFVCLSRSAFSAPVTPGGCTGPGFEELAMQGPAGDIDAVGSFGTLRRSFVASLSGEVFVQLSVEAQQCSSAGCSGSTPAYAGWQCGSAPGCTGYYGDVAVALPPPLGGTEKLPPLAATRHNGALVRSLLERVGLGSLALQADRCAEVKVAGARLDEGDADFSIFHRDWTGCRTGSFGVVYLVRHDRVLLVSSVCHCPHETTLDVAYDHRYAGRHRAHFHLKGGTLVPGGLRG